MFPPHLWRKLRTTNVIQRRFVEVRRRTRLMIVFSNVQSVDWIIYAIFGRINEHWKTHALHYLHKQLDFTGRVSAKRIIKLLVIESRPIPLRRVSP